MRRPFALAFGALVALSGCIETAGPGAAPGGTTAQPAQMSLAWEAGHPERAIWSTRLRTRIYKYLDTMGTPADIGAYCPRFADLRRSERVEVWAHLFVALAEQESGFNPAHVLPGKPPTGVDRVGLYALPYRDKPVRGCVYDPAGKSLEAPLNAIDCALLGASGAVKRDGKVAAGGGAEPKAGMARVFLSMRDGKGSKKAEVQAAVRALPLCR